MKKIAAAALLAFACTTTAPPEADLILEAPLLFDAVRGTYVRNATVVVRGDRVASVETAPYRGAGKRVTLPADTVLLPGLIDAHVHLGFTSDLAADARKTLHAGFTTVRDLGGGAAAAAQVNSGSIEGPRVQASGAGLGPATGICVQTFGPDGTITDEASAREVVRGQIAKGAGVIKVCAGGGVFAAPRDMETLEIEEKVLAAIVDEAHKGQRKVAAHAQGPKAILAAARAGVDSIEHGGLIDEAAANEMRARNTALVPTLARFDRALANAQPANKEALQRRRDAVFANARMAFERGVRVVLGTDGSVLPHGENARELRALVSIGMTPAQALQAATLHAGDLLDVRAGRVEPGYFADFVVVRGDPLVDIAAMDNVLLVVKGGRVIHDNH